MLFLLFTLLEALAVIAILIILGMLIYLAVKVKQLVDRAPTGGSGQTVAAAAQFTWITKPESFAKNTDTAFVVQLQKLNAINGNWEGYEGQDALVGAVEPASVSIVEINGQPPGTPESVSAIPAGVTVYRTATGTNGEVRFVLRGSEPADGQLFIFYVQSATDVKQAQAQFSVTD